MKKRYMSSLMAIVAATALSANVAIAHEGGVAGEGNLGSMGGHTVLDSSGKCVKTSSWSKEVATKECNPELFPKPVAQAAPPPPPPPPNRGARSRASLTMIARPLRSCPFRFSIAAIAGVTSFIAVFWSQAVVSQFAATVTGMEPPITKPKKRGPAIATDAGEPISSSIASVSASSRPSADSVS